MVKKTYSKDNRYHIPTSVKHSAKIYAGYGDITIFMQPDRYNVYQKNINLVTDSGNMNV